LTELEKRLLATEGGIAPEALRLCVLSRQRVDTGRWWRRSPLWVCATESHLILLAVSRRKYIEQVPLADCRDSRYNAESGELILAPVETLLFSRIRMSPRDALAVLRAIGNR